MKTIKLVVSDIDGTLIRRGEEFPQAVKDVVRELGKRGIGFTFASGRLPYMITPYMKEMELNVPVCACNGTLLYQGDTVLERHPMKIWRLRPLLEKSLNLDMTVLYAANGVEYCLAENEAVRRKARERGYYHEIRPLSEEEWDTLDVDKVNILDEKKGTPHLAPMEQELQGFCDITHYGDQGLEIVAAGYGKEYGLTRLAEMMGVPLDQVLAIGDNENDNAMLRIAGIGGVVGNGTPDTKACGDIVAEAEAGEGTAEIIRRVCLQEE